MVRRVLRLPTGRIARRHPARRSPLLAVFGPMLAPHDPLATQRRRRSPDRPARTGSAPTTSAATCSAGCSPARGSACSARVEVALIALVVGAVPGILSVYLGRAFEWIDACAWSTP